MSRTCLQKSPRSGRTVFSADLSLQLPRRTPYRYRIIPFLCFSFRGQKMNACTITPIIITIAKISATTLKTFIIRALFFSSIVTIPFVQMCRIKLLYTPRGRPVKGRAQNLSAQFSENPVKTEKVKFSRLAKMRILPLSGLLQSSDSFNFSSVFHK